MKFVLGLFIAGYMFAAVSQEQPEAMTLRKSKEHLEKVKFMFFDVAKDQKSVDAVVRFLADNMALFKGGRRIVTKASQGAGGLSDEEVRLINRWQTWMPAVRPDIGEGAFEAASDALREFQYHVKAPEDQREQGRLAMPGILKYMFALVGQDLWPGAKRLYTSEVDIMASGGRLGGSPGLVPLTPPLDIPDAFLASNNDFDDLLHFIYHPLQDMWNHLTDPPAKAIPRGLFEVLMYHCSLNVGQKNYGAQNLAGMMRRYLKNDLSLTYFREGETYISAEHESLNQTADAVWNGVQHIHQLYAVHPVPTEGVKTNRSLWIRLVDWFSMLHRLTMVVETKRQDNVKLPWSDKEVWSAMRWLLSQRLLAGEQVLKPVAEMLAASGGSEVAHEIYKDILYYSGGGRRDDAICLINDLQGYALFLVESRPWEATYAAVKNLFKLENEQVQALFVEAALEEIMLACDDLVAADDGSPEGPAGYIAVAFSRSSEKRVESDGKYVRRLRYALHMLSTALNSQGLDLLKKFETPISVLNKEYPAAAWGREYRQKFLEEMRAIIAVEMKMGYEEMRALTDQALAKILPHILANFDVQKEFPLYAPAPEEKHTTIAKVLKVKVVR